MTTTEDTATVPPLATDAPTTATPIAPVIPGTGTGLSLASLILGGTSLLAGFTFIAPIAGIVLGFMARSREPQARGFATAGIVLSAVALLGWVLAGLGIAAVGALALGSRLLHY